MCLCFWSLVKLTNEIRTYTKIQSQSTANHQLRFVFFLWVLSSEHLTKLVSITRRNLTICISLYFEVAQISSLRLNCIGYLWTETFRPPSSTSFSLFPALSLSGVAESHRSYWPSGITFRSYFILYMFTTLQTTIKIDHSSCYYFVWFSCIQPHPPPPVAFSRVCVYLLGAMHGHFNGCSTCAMGNAYTLLHIHTHKHVRIRNGGQHCGDFKYENQ